MENSDLDGASRKVDKNFPSIGGVMKRQRRLIQKRCETSSLVVLHIAAFGFKSFTNLLSKENK